MEANLISGPRDHEIDYILSRDPDRSLIISLLMRKDIRVVKAKGHRLLMRGRT